MGKHTSPNCSPHLGLSENDRIVRNFILHEEAFAEFPTLVPLMNLWKGGGACDQLQPFLWLRSHTPIPVTVEVVCSSLQ